MGSAVELNSGETAIVVAQNLVRRLQPRVMVIFDADGMLTHPLRILDLLRELKTAEGVPYRIGRALARDKLPFDAAELFL